MATLIQLAFSWGWLACIWAFAMGTEILDKILIPSLKSLSNPHLTPRRTIPHI
ncbi:MAG: hypothetical protein ACXVH2_11095 [Methanobacterium sp.]